MNELIKTELHEIAGDMVQTVNARNLHEFLESKQDFSTWIKSRIEKYDFIEGEDYALHKIMERQNQPLSQGQGRIDYHLTTETVKELAMVENNDRGREIRRYFIECERKAKKVVALPSYSEALRQLADTIELTQHQQQVIEQQTPKVEAFERIAGADGSLCLTDAAKELQMRPRDLIAWLSANQWIYKRAGGGSWVGYQSHIQCGNVEHKSSIVVDAGGQDRIRDQVRITAKGLTKLAGMLQKVAA